MEIQEQEKGCARVLMELADEEEFELALQRIAEMESREEHERAKKKKSRRRK